MVNDVKTKPPEKPYRRRSLLGLDRPAKFNLTDAGFGEFVVDSLYSGRLDFNYDKNAFSRQYLDGDYSDDSALRFIDKVLSRKVLVHQMMGREASYRFKWASFDDGSKIEHTDNILRSSILEMKRLQRSIVVNKSLYGTVSLVQASPILGALGFLLYKPEFTSSELEGFLGAAEFLIKIGVVTIPAALATISLSALLEKHSMGFSEKCMSSMDRLKYLRPRVDKVGKILDDFRNSLV